MSYRAEKIQGAQTKYYVIDVETGERMAILEAGCATSTDKGWDAWSWDDGARLLWGAFAGSTLEIVLRHADDWI